MSLRQCLDQPNDCILRYSVNVDLDQILSDLPTCSPSKCSAPIRLTSNQPK
jgi:hypothetical protein